MGQGEGRDWTQEELDAAKAIFAKPISSSSVLNDYSSDLQFQIAKLELGPDDVLLVSYSRNFASPREIDLLVKVLHNIGLGNRIVVVPDDFEFSVISKNKAESVVAQQRKPPERIIDLP